MSLFMTVFLEMLIFIRRVTDDWGQMFECKSIILNVKSIQSSNLINGKSIGNYLSTEGIVSFKLSVLIRN